MNDAAASLRLKRCSDPFNRLAHGNELLIARKLLDPTPFDGFEHHEIADQIEKVRGREKAGKQNVLPCGRPAELGGQGFRRQRIGVLPLGPLARRGQCGTILRHVPSDHDGNLRRLEKARCAKSGKFIPAFVSLKLANAFAHGIGKRGRLAFDHGKRQAVHIDDDIRNDVLTWPLGPNLSGEFEDIRRNVVEIEESNRAILPATVFGVGSGDAIGQRRMPTLVRFHQIDGSNARYGGHRPSHAVWLKPWVEVDKALGQSSGQDRLRHQPLAQAVHICPGKRFVVEQDAQEIGGRLLHPFEFQLVVGFAHAA